MNLSILYRGPLTSCNYACRYCPFAKRFETDAQLARDRESLDRFVDRLTGESTHTWRVLFTPWGEALIRAWYREAVAILTHVAHIESVCAQTNLSADLNWIAGCRTDKLALWATYHPTENTRPQFLRQVAKLQSHGVRLSVGMVGVSEFLPEIQAMRRELPDDVYLWINAQQPRPRPYTDNEIGEFAAIDPQFISSYRRQPSLGAACRTGETSFTVDGRGNMRRCHFVDEVIGNFYRDNWTAALRQRACPNRFCDCFLGKSQLLADDFVAFFGANGFERIPSSIMHLIE